MTKSHWAIFTDNNSLKDDFIHSLQKGANNDLKELKDLNGALFSKKVLERFIDEEDRHDTKVINVGKNQSVKSMSSGEQKKALLNYLLSLNPDFLILDNPFDNLDVESQADLKVRLNQVRMDVIIVQLNSRKEDVLPFTDRFAKLTGKELYFYDNSEQLTPIELPKSFDKSIPEPPFHYDYDKDILIELKGVSVKYLDKAILQNIHWSIKKGEFWELRGRNGSGKTTILSMITGENPKGYGQELYIFGNKKGSGESVWEIKKRIGYFTPFITNKFTGYHSVEHMIISGLKDSIGLYTKPSEIQKRLAKQWLQLIDMWSIKDHLFHDLTMGQKRLIMCARAMVKHPPLLILDEPTAGLDDQSAALFVALVNKFAKASNTTTIFVSHRKEPGLNPDLIYQLEVDDQGSKGYVIKN